MRYYRYRLQPDRSNRKGLIFWSLLLVIGIPLLVVTAAEAQVKESVERELEKTDVVIQRAKEAVSESRNPKAENLLEMAVGLQEKAKNAFHAIRYRLAVTLTLSARKKAYEAIGYTKKDEENENLVLKAIERTDQIISKAKEAASGLENRRGFSLLEGAVSNQQKAKEFFKEHKLKMALKFTLKAREMAQKLLDLANGERGLDRLAQKELEIIDRLIEKASVIIRESQNPKAEQLLNQAENLLSKARDMSNQRKYKQATKDSKKARGLIQKALRLVEEDITPQMVENAIQQNERLIDKLEKKMKTGINLEAVNTFEEGLSHQSKANEYYNYGKFKAALAEAKVAKILLDNSLKTAQEGKK